MCAPPPSQVSSAIQTWTHKSVWKVDAIVARRFKRCHEALVRWAGFDSSFDSWEPEDDIHPGLIKEYESARLVDAVDISPVMEALQDSISSRLLESRQEQFGLIVPLPGAAFPAVAKQVAELLRRPQSRKGKAPLPLKQVRSGQRVMREQVTLTKLEDLEALAQLHVTRPGKGWGAVRFSAGRKSNEDLMVLAPPLVLNIEYKELRGWRRAPSCEVYVCFNTVRFLGKYGTARVHADALACGHIGTATRRELMMYVRKVLRRSDVKHGLSAVWAHLPASVSELSPEQAMPSA